VAHFWRALRVKGLVRALKGEKWQLVLLVDEIDRALHHEGLNNAGFYGGLRSVRPSSYHAGWSVLTFAGESTPQGQALLRGITRGLHLGPSTSPHGLQGLALATQGKEEPAGRLRSQRYSSRNATIGSLDATRRAGK